LKYIPLDPDDIREIHDVMLERYDGLEGEHEPGSIDFIADKPFTEVFGYERYQGIFLKAAVYMYSLATSQFFVDGNKRTAYGCAALFLELNDYMLRISDEDLYFTSIAVAKEEMTLEELAEWLEVNSMKF
jgi:death-on-curing protein